MSLHAPHTDFGTQLRAWRARRRLSQLDMALEADISQKHLSFLESGRAAPSRAMVLRLAEGLDVPLRERNALLMAAGYAPVYPARRLDDASLAAARAAIDLLLKGHEPFPALAVDRHWNMIAANVVAGGLLTALVAPSLREAPVNVVRASLHPDGLAPHIVNLAQWRAHLLYRLDRQIAASGDEGLRALRDEMAALPAARQGGVDIDPAAEVFVPLILETPQGRLSLFSTITIFGTPVDVTLAEIAIESFFPADEATRRVLLSLREGAAIPR